MLIKKIILPILFGLVIAVKPVTTVSPFTVVCMGICDDLTMSCAEKCDENLMGHWTRGFCHLSCMAVWGTCKAACLTI